MTYLEENLIQSKGTLQRELRINMYHVLQVYSFKGNEYKFHVFKPFEKEFKKMSKFAQKKAEMEKGKSINLSKGGNGLTLEGTAIAKDIREKLESLNSRLMVIENQNKELKAQNEKLYSFLFNSESSNKTFIETLLEIKNALCNLPKVETVKPTEQKKGETTTQEKPEITGNPVETFKKYFSGNFREDDFKGFFNSCDFSSQETIENSFKEFNRQSSNLLCARKSNKNFIAALIETYKALSKGDKGKKITEKASSPVFSLKTFSTSLGVSLDVIKEIVSDVEKENCFDDETEETILDMLLEENEDLNETSYNEFIAFLRKKF